MKLVLPLVALSLVAAPAYSGGFVSPIVSDGQTPVVVSSDANWTSNYAGVMLGYGKAEREVSQGNQSENGFSGALLVGRMQDFGTWVGAVELMAAPGFGAEVAERKVKWAVAARAKAGVKFGVEDRWLGFATVGVGRGKTESDSGQSRTANGYLYGVGFNYLVSDTLMVGGEVLRAEKTGDGDADATGLGASVAYRF